MDDHPWWLCDHLGIGWPGCPTCDERLNQPAINALREGREEIGRIVAERNRLRLVVIALDEIRGEVLHGGPVMRTPNEVLDLIDRATAHLEVSRG